MEVGEILYPHVFGGVQIDDVVGEESEGMSTLETGWHGGLLQCESSASVVDVDLGE